MVRTRITFDDYKEALLGDHPLYVSYNKISSRNHVVSTTLIRKRCMSSFDGENNPILSVSIKKNSYFLFPFLKTNVISYLVRYTLIRMAHTLLKNLEIYVPSASNIHNQKRSSKTFIKKWKNNSTK